jgi:hypothetical protein
MSSKSNTETNGVVTLATGALLVIVLLIAASGYAVVRTEQTADMATRNRLHLCWMTSTIFGAPGGDALEACDTLRDSIQDSVSAW